MRILLVKTSSLGDVIHNLPVAADLGRQFPGIEIDWCVEESFADIPRLSPTVRETIPVAIRRWRKHLFSGVTWQEIGALRHRLASSRYDAILDTQGLLKSALISRLARGRRLGLDKGSAREPIAAHFYDQSYAVARDLHAVERNRRLAAAAFGYALPVSLDYGIAAPTCAAPWLPSTPIAVLLTATSRDDKLWPEAGWMALGRELTRNGLVPVLPAGNAVERARAQRIAGAIPGAIVAPPLTIHELAGVIGRAKVAIGVDTGLAHLAAALNIPTVAIYTATDPALTGVVSAGFFRNIGNKGESPSASEVLATVTQALHA